MSVGSGTGPALGLASMSEWVVGAPVRGERAIGRLGSGPIDQQSRGTNRGRGSPAALHPPADGDIEILLHEMARALERVAETGSASSGPVGVSVAQLNACASALE